MDMTFGEYINRVSLGEFEFDQDVANELLKGMRGAVGTKKASGSKSASKKKSKGTSGSLNNDKYHNGLEILHGEGGQRYTINGNIKSVHIPYTTEERIDGVYYIRPDYNKSWHWEDEFIGCDFAKLEDKGKISVFFDDHIMNYSKGEKNWQEWPIDAHYIDYSVELVRMVTAGVKLAEKTHRGDKKFMEMASKGDLRYYRVMACGAVPKELRCIAVAEISRDKHIKVFMGVGSNNPYLDKKSIEKKVKTVVTGMVEFI